MQADAAKRVVLIGMLAAAGIAGVQAVRQGRRPSVRLGVGMALGTIALTALADPAPAIAAGLAGTTAFGSLVYNTGALDAAVGALDATGTVKRRTAPTYDLSVIGQLAGAGGGFVETPAPDPDAGGGGGFGARGPDDLVSNPSAGTVAGCTDPAQLQLIGQGNHKLAPAAAVAFARAEQLYGGRITVTDSYRSCAHQQQRYEETRLTEPGRFAPAKSSRHTRGEAVDVNLVVMGASNSKLFAALRTAGWCQARPSDEPWHWSYNGCG